MLRFLLPYPVSAASAIINTRVIPQGWKLHDGAGLIRNVGTYTFAGPPDMVEVPVQGVDSYVAKFRSAGLTMSFDFGQYGNADACGKDSSCIKITVDGVIATRSSFRPEESGFGLRGIFYYIPFPVVHEGRSGKVSLTIYATCIKSLSCDRTDQIVNTIKFVPLQ